MSHRTIGGVQSYNDAARVISTMAIDGINQFIDVMGEKSGGAINLAGMTTEGDFLERIVQKDLQVAGYRRDPESTAVRVATPYEETEHRSVKISGGFGPIEVPSAILMFVERGGGVPGAAESSAMTHIAKQYRDFHLKDQLNTSIGCCAAALEGDPLTFSDQSLGGNPLNQISINTAISKFEDMSPMLTVLVIPGFANHDLLGDAIGNSNALDTVGGIAIREGKGWAQGRLIVVTDSPALTYNDGVTDVHAILALQAGAINVTEVKQTVSMNQSTGTDNITREIQWNYDYRAGLKGIAWSSTIDSPTDAELFTTVNWTAVTTSHKHRAGVKLVVPQGLAKTA